MGTIEQVLAAGAVRSVFQPIVDLPTGRVVAYEALARGPEGPLARPDALFGAARSAGRLAELDAACRRSAFRGAMDAGILAPLALFVNVEPEVLDSSPVDELLTLAEAAPGRLRVVLEITERALAARPAELLRTVERVRELGWAVALDDVGAEDLSLAFMPLLRPEIVKLDLSLVQERPGPAVAEIMNAVNAYAEQTGAVVLAEGIETEHHLVMSRALGARLGQGWMFGRPRPGQDPVLEAAELVLPAPPAARAEHASPFSLLPLSATLQRSPKSLLIEVSKQLEREAMRQGSTCVVGAAFQEARHFTPATAARYRDLVARTAFVCAIGEGLPTDPVPGLRGADLEAGDALRGEWDVTVLGPHFSAALLARDLGDTGPDAERMFEYALTYDRPTVVEATAVLLSRVAPRLPVATSEPPAPQALVPAAAARPAAVVPVSAGAEVLLHRALAATTSGVTISDMRRPDQPLVYVNQAFERLSGLRADEVLGRNCRFLQGPDSDVDVIAGIRAAISAGTEYRGVVLNYRGEERTPWWNEIHLAPVVDAGGRVVQYIGVQNDVTTRVEAERALVRERDRAQGYLARIRELAFTDPLTGLANRRGIEERAEAVLAEARADGSAVAVLFWDLDGFKPVNDTFGHDVGDQLLVRLARRLRGAVRRSDLLARLGGDEFLVVLPGLEPETAPRQAARIAEKLAEEVAGADLLPGRSLPLGASVGASTFPADGETFRDLLHHADQRMYAAKRARAARAVPVPRTASRAEEDRVDAAPTAEDPVNTTNATASSRPGAVILPS